ncbi:hypothetical protein ACFOY2_05580 [Nonomuraea purpurea]|uniref:DUF2637 domain-containing protein n=1 Tax=Nonomuraea purpurea TaxID=1849276 RepID=A0ABV8FY64_9ACTN
MNWTNYLPPEWVVWTIVGVCSVIVTWFTSRAALDGIRHAALALRRRSGDKSGKTADRRPLELEDILTWVMAGIATAVSASGMWKFAGDVLKLEGFWRVLFFAFIEGAIVISALRARRSMRENYTAGLDGIAVWALAALTAILASLDTQQPQEAIFRLAAPLVAAWLWERGMRLERRKLRGLSGINWRVTPERVLVWLGLAEVRDRSAAQVDAHRRLTRVALAAKRAKALRDGGASDRKVRAALAKLDKAMDAAVEHTGLPRDAAMQEALLDQITSLYGGASLLDLPDSPPWRQLDHRAITGKTRLSETARLVEETEKLSAAVLAGRDPDSAATIEMLASMLMGRRIPTPGSATKDQVSPSVADLVAGRVSLRAVPSPPTDTRNDTRTDTSRPVSAKVSPEVSDEEVDAIIAALRDEESDTGDDTDSDTETATVGATEAMRRHFDAEIAKGRVPSGPELADVGKCGESYGRRKRKDWLDELDGRTRRRLVGPKRVTA